MLGLHTKREINYNDRFYTIKDEKVIKIVVMNIYDIMNNRVRVSDVQSGIIFKQETHLLFDNEADAIKTLNYYIERDVAGNQEQPPYEETEEDIQLERHLNTVAGLDYLNYE